MTPREQLKEKLNELIEARVWLEHKIKRSLYNDNFYAADNYEAELDEVNDKIKQVKKSIELC